MNNNFLAAHFLSRISHAVSQKNCSSVTCVSVSNTQECSEGLKNITMYWVCLINPMTSLFNWVSSLSLFFSPTWSLHIFFTSSLFDYEIKIWLCFLRKICDVIHIPFLIHTEAIWHDRQYNGKPVLFSWTVSFTLILWSSMVQSISTWYLYINVINK